MGHQSSKRSTAGILVEKHIVSAVRCFGRMILNVASRMESPESRTGQSAAEIADCIQKPSQQSCRTPPGLPALRSRSYIRA